MDAQGTEVARRFTESAGAKFTTAIDRAQGLWELYGFNVVPNGFFVDEQGVLRYMKIGGFDVRNAEDAQAIERLLASPPSFGGAGANAAPKTETLEEAVGKALGEWRKAPGDVDRLLNLAERRAEAKQYAQARRDFETALKMNPRSARALMGLATIYFDRSEREKALEALKKAWALDPENWIIRKQIWAVEHPDQFYPAINFAWQKEQIEKEDAARK